jgi:uncharacterized membrane protein YhdT
LFWLKITSFGRGALGGTRWVHFNYNNKKKQGLAGDRGGPTWYSMVFIEYPLFLHKNQVYILIYMYVYSEK